MYTSQVGSNSKNIVITFTRCPERDLDLENGVHNPDRKKVLNVKYEKQVRMCFGMAMEEINNIIVG